MYAKVSDPERRQATNAKDAKDAKVRRQALNQFVLSLASDLGVLGVLGVNRSSSGVRKLALNSVNPVASLDQRP